MIGFKQQKPQFINPLRVFKLFLHIHKNAFKTKVNENFLSLFVSKVHFMSLYLACILKLNSVKYIFATTDLNCFGETENTCKTAIKNDDPGSKMFNLKSSKRV